MLFILKVEKENKSVLFLLFDKMPTKDMQLFLCSFGTLIIFELPIHSYLETLLNILSFNFFF